MGKYPKQNVTSSLFFQEKTRFWSEEIYVKKQVLGKELLNDRRTPEKPIKKNVEILNWREPDKIEG